VPSSAVPSPSSSVVHMLFGTLRRPRRTFERLAGHPQWLAALLLTFGLMFAARVGVLLTPVGQQALTDQWTSRAEAFGQPVTDQNYPDFVALGARGPEIGAATAVATGLLLVFALPALSQVLLKGTSGATYRQALAVTAHAGTVLTVRELVAAPVNYVRESLASPLTLGTVFPGLDEVSAGARFLGMIDLFVAWWLVVLAIGLAVIYRRSALRLAGTFLALYVGFGLVMAGAMALLTGRG